MDSPTFFFFQSSLFNNREQSVMRGFEIQGKLDLKKTRSILSLGSELSVSPRNTMARISLAVPQAVGFRCAPGGRLSLLGARVGCTFCS